MIKKFRKISLISIKRVFLTKVPKFLPKPFHIQYWLMLSRMNHIIFRCDYIKNISVYKKDEFHTLFFLSMTDGNLLIQDLSRINRFLGGKNHSINRLHDQYIQIELYTNVIQDRTIEPEAVIDIGANIGEFTIAVANKIENSVIYAFEPDPLAFECLEFNIRESNLGNRVRIFNYALSNKSGESLFYISTADADSSLIQPKKYTGIINVISMRGDDFIKQLNIPQVSLLKMDAEGFEPEILEGFGEFISKIDFFALDVGPEREGVDTEVEVTRILKKRGAIVKVFKGDGLRKFINAHWVAL